MIDGFKTEIKENSIENLKFDTYLASFPIDEKKIYTKSDPNALGLYELLKENNIRNKVIILLRLIDSLIIVSICVFYYMNVIKKNDYNLTNQLFFIAVSILCLTIDNLLESYTIENIAFVFILILNILIIHFFPTMFKLIKINNEI